MASQGAKLPPHVLIFPLPIQGHISSMLRLAELLCLAELHVTFIVSEFCHNHLLKHTNVESRFACYPGFSFQTISDGLPEDHPRAGERFADIMPALRRVTALLFNKMMIEKKWFASSTRRPITCIIADGVLSFTADFAEENGIPLVYFRTASAVFFWASFCMPKLIEAGEIAFTGNDMNLMVKSVPGMEDIIRRRDLPGYCRVNDLNDTTFQIIKNETQQSPRAQAFFILNTFEDLEGPVLSHIRKHLPRLYTIGPNHFHLTSRLAAATKTENSISSGSLWEEDRSCLAWLDSQPTKSVIYASFGSITVVTREQLEEFWYGLVNSGQRFLWVIRPDSIMGEDSGSRPIPDELQEGTKSRGYMVGWAPQLEVLNHPAIGGFLTHSGRNSTLESMVAGVPMICWPYFADQMINSRFVGEVWKIGLDMKDTCDRVIIEKMVRDLMHVRKDEFLRRADDMAKLTRKVVHEGGSSYTSLNSLIEFIKSMVSN
ncbi:hypothetical protein ACH5RR_016753 [Cinchona calisaya]|uniref:Glycosyltransferase n=1 Tax=Cinchona calisaya TaxID=153742 RepID=A0ABD2ZWV4_9GENT